MTTLLVLIGLVVGLGIWYGIAPHIPMKKTWKNPNEK
mgnify:CR=1 FL=1